MRQERDDALPPRSSLADARYGPKPRPQPSRAPAPEPRSVPAPRPPSAEGRKTTAPRTTGTPRGVTARPTTTPRTVTARPTATPRPTERDYDIDFQTDRAGASPTPAPKPPINFKSYHIARQSQTSERHEAEATVALPTPAPDCPRCHGAGYVRVDVPMGHPLFGKAIACHCKEEEMEGRRRHELYRMSSLDAFEGLTFDSFNPSIPGTREAWEVARHYADDPDGWLVLSGPCGSGKTHLAAAIANLQFSQGAQVLLVLVPKLLDHLRATSAPSAEVTYDELFTKVCEAGLLVLDDLGAEHTTPWAQEKLFQLINHRYIYGLPTVFTTNHDLQRNDMDDRVRSRLYDISLVRHVVINAADYRSRHIAQHRRGGTP